jgi:hypothetical protein
MVRWGMCIAVALTLPACSTPSPAPRTAGSSIDVIDAGPIAPPPLDEDLTALLAADRLSEWPEVRDPVLTQELTLYAALFVAAEHLDGAPEGAPVMLEIPLRQIRTDLGVDFETMCLRILAEATALKGPAAWSHRAIAPADLATGHVRFPGEDLRPGVIGVQILQRNTGQATVRARLRCMAPDGRGLSREVEALWDGRNWQVEPVDTAVRW